MAVLKTEKKYLDKWSLAHLLGGAVLSGLFFYLSDFSFIQNIFLAIVIMFIWEIYEDIKGTKESLGNSWADIVLGILGFLIFSAIIF